MTFDTNSSVLFFLDMAKFIKSVTGTGVISDSGYRKDISPVTHIVVFLLMIYKIKV